MLSVVILILVLCRHAISSVQINVTANAQFIHNETSFQIVSISMISDDISCTCQCWADSACITATYVQTTKICALFSVQLSQGYLKIMPRETHTTTITFLTRTAAAYGVNLLINGDAEIGPCTTNGVITSPTGWFLFGSITQMSYNNTFIMVQSYTTPGPSDRGHCYFLGNLLQLSSIFQEIDLSAYIDHIDNEDVPFNLSAWLDGSATTTNVVTVSIIFQNAASQMQTNPAVIRSISNGITGTVLYQTTGSVPVNTGSAIVSVNMTGNLFGVLNSASADNIHFELTRN